MQSKIDSEIEPQTHMNNPKILLKKQCGKQ